MGGDQDPRGAEKSRLRCNRQTTPFDLERHLRSLALGTVEDRISVGIEGGEHASKLQVRDALRLPAPKQTVISIR